MTRVKDLDTVSGDDNQSLKYGLSADEQIKLSLLLIVVCNCLPVIIFFTYLAAVVATTIIIDVGLMVIGFIISMPFFLFSTFMAVCGSIIIIAIMSFVRRETIEYFMGVQSDEK